MRGAALLLLLLAAVPAPAGAQTNSTCVPQPGGGTQCYSLDSRTGRSSTTTIQPNGYGGYTGRTQDYGTGSPPPLRAAPPPYRPAPVTPRPMAPVPARPR